MKTNAQFFQKVFLAAWTQHRERNLEESLEIRGLRQMLMRTNQAFRRVHHGRLRRAEPSSDFFGSPFPNNSPCSLVHTKNLAKYSGLKRPIQRSSATTFCFKFDGGCSKSKSLSHRGQSDRIIRRREAVSPDRENRLRHSLPSIFVSDPFRLPERLKVASSKARMLRSSSLMNTQFQPELSSMHSGVTNSCRVGPLVEALVCRSAATAFSRGAFGWSVRHDFEGSSR